MSNTYSFDCNNHQGYCQIDNLFSTNNTITNKQIKVQADKKTYLLNTKVRVGSLTVMDLFNNIISSDNYTINYLNGTITFIQSMANDIIVTYDEIVDPTLYPELVAVEFWFKWTGRYGTIPFGFNNYGLLFYREYFGFTTGNNDIYGMSALGLEKKWHHVYAIFNINDITKNQIILDGKQRILLQRTGIPIVTNLKFSNTAMLGSWPATTTNKFDGLIDEFRIWTVSKSVRDIKMDMYNVVNEKSLNYDNLIAYYRFDENNPQIKDYSKNNRCIYMISGNFSTDVQTLDGYNVPQSIMILNPVNKIAKNSIYNMSYIVQPPDPRFKEISVQLTTYNSEDDMTFFVHEINKSEWSKIIDLEVK